MKNFKLFLESKQNLNQDGVFDDIWNNKINLVKKHIKNGFDVNSKEHFGCHPLHIATYNKNLKMLNLLLKNGADLTVKNDFGETPLNLEKDFFKRYDVQKCLIEQNPLNVSLLRKNNIELHPNFKDKYSDLEIGSDLGTI